MKIRPFLPADQAAVRELVLNGLGEHFGSVDPSLNPDLDDIAATYGAAGRHFIVVEMNGQIVGCGCLMVVGPATGQIVRMSVDGRLRNHGIGRAIIKQLLDLARMQNFSEVLVETNYDWLPAIALYRSCGFQEYARDRESVYFTLPAPKLAA